MGKKIIPLGLIGVLITISNITLAEDNLQKRKYTNGEFPAKVLIKIYDSKNKLITGIKEDKFQYHLIRKPKENRRSELQEISLIQKPLMIKFDISELAQGEYKLHIYTQQINNDQRFTAKTIRIINNEED